MKTELCGRKHVNFPATNGCDFENNMLFSSPQSPCEMKITCFLPFRIVENNMLFSFRNSAGKTLLYNNKIPLPPHGVMG